MENQDRRGLELSFTSAVMNKNSCWFPCEYMVQILLIMCMHLASIFIKIILIIRAVSCKRAEKGCGPCKIL